MERDPMECLVQSDWFLLQEEFKTDWPRGAQAYYALETQRKWTDIGLDYGFRVYCPFGNVRNGMVALNLKESFYEVIIQCPRDDTSKLEEALFKTQVIDWSNSKIVIPFTPRHVYNVLQRILPNLSVKITESIPSCSFIYYKDKPSHEISLPSKLRFGLLTQEHVSLVDSVWPHRYHGSQWFFTQLIKANSGYGLYVNDVLVCWAFIYEVGTLGHLYTLEGQRRKGYGEIMLKLIINEHLKRNEDVLAFTVAGNVKSIELFQKMGFENYGCSSWNYLHQTKLQNYKGK